MSSNPPPEQPVARVRGRFDGLLPRSLTTRLILTTLLLVALVSVVVGIVTTLELRRYLVARLDEQLYSASQRHEGGGPGGPGGPGGIPDEICLLVPPGQTRGIVVGQAPGTVLALVTPTCRYAVVVTDAGTLLGLARSDASALTALSASGHPRTVSLSGGDYRVVVQSGFGIRSVTGLPLSDVNATVNSLVLWESAVALAGVALAALIGQALVRRQLSPLRRVAATATNVTRLPLDSGEVGVIDRVPAELTDATTEVGQVGAALNAMLGHVERALDTRQESEQRVRQFVADASHELRTPLSTIMGYAELSRRTSADPASMVHAMTRIQSEGGRMSALVDDLLLLARLDSGRPLERVDVDVSLLLAEAVNDARVLSPDRTWRLALPSDAVHVVGDRDRLHQVVSNVLTNAIRHTAPGTLVSVSAEGTARVGDRPHGVLVVIHDNGPGIPSSLAGKEFERFSRGEASRTRDAGGSGLGLSIVRAIVTAHRGTAEIHSVPGDTTISIWLPSPDLARV